jgi:Protein of unknown function (DUF2950)
MQVVRNEKLGNIRRGLLMGAAAVAFCGLVGGVMPVQAQEAGQQTFASPDAATQALFAAAQKNDESAMLTILGKEGQKVIKSGDPAEDEAMRANFVAKYQVMHRLVEEPDATTTLYIGAENWPTPIPLVNRAGKWYFDTDAAKKEILFRRIGQNELSAIRVCQELVLSQKEFAAKNNGEFAAKFVADAGKQNGLYWPAAGSDAGSPIGPLVANAGSEGGITRDNVTGAEPFRGYYFRILDRQGKKASGGAMNYVVDGKMSKGFAFVAYPAVYRDSGVMTFVVSQDGVVYERDLGKGTAEKAKSMKAFDPDTMWVRSEIIEPTASADNK